MPESILLSQVLSHSCNIGYETNRNMRLVKLNGESVCSLAHLKSLIEISTQQNLVFEFSSGQIMVVDREAAIDSNDQVSTRLLKIRLLNIQYR